MIVLLTGWVNRFAHAGDTALGVAVDTTMPVGSLSLSLFCFASLQCKCVFSCKLGFFFSGKGSQS